MSSIVNKIKEVVHSDHHSKSSEPEGTHGPHGSRMANAADPRIDSDHDRSHTVGGGNNNYSSNNNYSYGSGNTGFGSGPAPNTAGPHKSDMMNKADPRIDSDRDGSKTMGGNNLGSGNNFSSHNRNDEGLHGPHGSRMANAADPRVDSDRDGSRTMGGNHNTIGTSTGISAGISSHSRHAEGEHGPHGSRLANAADPRVDSDRDGSRTMGGNTYGGSTIGGDNTFGHNQRNAEGLHGPHGSRMANAADPRVDSDRDGSRTMGGSHNTGGLHNTMGHTGAALGGVHGTGPAPNTAGPHKSDMMNKADPRVDSDLDGSKTMGRDQTYSQS